MRDRFEVPALRVDVVESVGAWGHLRGRLMGGRLFGLDQAASLRRGHLGAACTLTVDGDRGPLPAQAIMDAVLRCNAADWAATWVDSAVCTPRPAGVGSATHEPEPLSLVFFSSAFVTIACVPQAAAFAELAGSRYRSAVVAVAR